MTWLGCRWLIVRFDEFREKDDRENKFKLPAKCEWSRREMKFEISSEALWWGRQIASHQTYTIWRSLVTTIKKKKQTNFSKSSKILIFLICREKWSFFRKINFRHNIEYSLETFLIRSRGFLGLSWKHFFEHLCRSMNSIRHDISLFEIFWQFHGEWNLTFCGCRNKLNFDDWKKCPNLTTMQNRASEMHETIAQLDHRRLVAVWLHKNTSEECRKKARRKMKKKLRVQSVDVNFQLFFFIFTFDFARLLLHVE